MSDRSDSFQQQQLRDKLIGLGERSLRKSHYAALQRSLRDLEEKDRLIREAYSDVIAAITGGRLIILGKDELRGLLGAAGGEPHALRDSSQLGDARRIVRDALGRTPAADNLILAFSEAATNMLKHARGGTFRVERDGDCVRLVLSDNGPGIDFRHLPKATLTPGYSSTQTLGMGFTLMLELSDRLLLCTDPGGTTLVLEKDVSTAAKTERLDMSRPNA